MDTPPDQDPSVNKIESLDWNQLMVEIRSLDFSYKRKAKFMQNLNMSVPKSAIYGLLGPSGCGKTSLLKIILGLMRPQNGFVRVNGKRPGDPNNNIPGTGVGFMPQELALYQEFTLNEALRYFSRIYGMTDEEIVMRTKFLVDFLDLPDPDRLISQMSGGQKRRVSLSLSLVHNPPLLVLDEPTVGTDPVLRERIWDHLVVLSRKESTTIIITTHYIEEARRAHVISLMRKGKLLVEHSPQYLLHFLCAQNLEEVFLSLCQENPNKSDDMPKSYYETFKEDNGITIEGNDNKLIIKNGSNIGVQTKPVTTEQRIMNQINKNYIKLIRNKPLLIFETILPTFCIIIFFLCIGTKPFGLKIAVYNEEYIPENLKALNISAMSVDLLQCIDNKTIVLIHYSTKESAIDAVRGLNEVYGTLIIPQNFTVNLVNRFFAKLKATNKSIEESTVSFFADFTDMIITETITKAMIEAEIRFQRKVISTHFKSEDNSQLQEKIFDPLIRFENPPIYGSLDPQFRNFMCPGMILAVIYVMAMGLTALSLVIERKEGLMERALVAGVKQHEILLSQVVLQFFIVCIQTTLLLIFTFVVFHLPVKGNFGLIISIILLQGLTGMCYGLVISAICSNENTAVMAALGSFYPYFLLSGIIWPLEGMPYAIKILSYFLPQTLAIVSLRNIILKGWFLNYTFVYLGFVSTIIWMFIFLTIAALILKIRDNPYFMHIFSSSK